MNTAETNIQTIDTTTQDFKTAVVIVSLTTNLAVFITWLTVTL